MNPLDPIRPMICCIVSLIENLPSSLLSAFQMITIAVHHTIPAPGHAISSPIRLWYIHSYFPLLEWLLSPIQMHSLADKFGDTTSSGVQKSVFPLTYEFGTDVRIGFEVFHAYIIRHTASQSTANGYHSGRVSANKNGRLFFVPF